jgi:hypothetical protein
MVNFYKNFVDCQPAEVDRPSFKKSPLYPFAVLAGEAAAGAGQLPYPCRGMGEARAEGQAQPGGAHRCMH